jgi:hypothetical protein
MDHAVRGLSTVSAALVWKGGRLKCAWDKSGTPIPARRP